MSSSSSVLLTFRAFYVFLETRRLRKDHKASKRSDSRKRHYNYSRKRSIWATSYPKIFTRFVDTKARLALLFVRKSYHMDSIFQSQVNVKYSVEQFRTPENDEGKPLVDNDRLVQPEGKRNVLFSGHNHWPKWDLSIRFV